LSSARTALIFTAPARRYRPGIPRLEKITPDNVEAACRLTVRPDQEQLVAPVARSLAEAYVQPEIAWPRLIVEQLVGFVMGSSWGRGYGRFAVGSVCEEIRRRGQDRATVTWVPGDHGPERFNLRLGSITPARRVATRSSGSSP
jgi:diamine N-acetyltransferase